ncbi:MAG: SH3 domain-containing protein [Desulfococcaceae bacterium]
MKETGNALKQIGYGSFLVLSLTLAAWMPVSQVQAQQNQPVETETADPQETEPMAEETTGQMNEEPAPEMEAAEAASESEKVDLDQPLPTEEDTGMTPPETAEAMEEADVITAEPPEEAPNTATLKVSTGNVRLQPSLEAGILTHLELGDTVKVLDTQEDWYHIQLPDGDTGWAHQSLFLTTGVALTLTVDKGNVRTEPTTRAEVKIQLNKGDTVKVLNSIEEWYQVQLPDGETGWMHSQLFVNPADRREQQAAQKTYQLEAIRIESGKGSEEKAYFVFDGPKPPKTFFTQTGPTRVVCNFPNTRLSRDIRHKNVVNGQLIQNVRIGLHGEDKSDAWVVFDLVQDQEYELEHIFLEGRIYMLIFKKA